MNTYSVENHTLDPLYYERMAASLGDKVAMLPFIKPGVVYDVGSGGGELGHAVSQLVENTSVFGIDPFPHPESLIPVIKGYAPIVAQLDTKADTIIACSVMHEVFSYGNVPADENGTLNIGDIHSIHDTMRAFYDALKPGGRLIIRDGVAPHNAHMPGMMMFMNPEDDVWVERFLKESPFVGHMHDRNVELEKVRDGVWTGDIQSLTEFAFTYTWGASSWEREVNEFYTVMGVSDYEKLALEVGFKVKYMNVYTQEGYRTHLKDKLSFDFKFPATNSLYVFEKP